MAESESRKNVELKARIHDADRARQIAGELTGAASTELRQVDTYFRVAHGRLKLREINESSAELIGYDRANHADARESRYRIVTIDDPESLKAMLGSSIGIRSVVRKCRQLYLYENVRIHLDHVESLGDFLEFEAVLGPSHGESEGHERVAWLRERFEIDEKDLLSKSYVDLIATRPG